MGVAVGSAEMGWAVTGGPLFTGIAVLAMGLEDGDSVEIKGLADGEIDTDAVGLELGDLDKGLVGDVLGN